MSVVINFEAFRDCNSITGNQLRNEIEKFRGYSNKTKDYLKDKCLNRADDLEDILNNTKGCTLYRFETEELTEAVLEFIRLQFPDTDLDNWPFSCLDIPEVLSQVYESWASITLDGSRYYYNDCLPHEILVW